MSILSDYTTCGSIRAVLGVSEEEITDSVFDEVIYLTALTEQLLAISSTLDTYYLALVATPPSAAADKRLYNLVQTYSAYYIAAQLTSSLPIFSPKIVKDSQTDMERVDDPFKGIKVDVAYAMSRYQVLLQSAYAGILNVPAPTSIARTNVVSTGLGLDPVTNV